MLEELPLCLRVVNEAHRILMSGGRGTNKTPGDLRRIQNWIGPPGSDPETATYVPIAADRLPDAMARWERYINDRKAPDPLVQLAVLHAEFEALHPFLDGNGRVGRLLVPLFLWRRGLIARPVFYISAWLEANRPTYYDGLLRVSRDDDWTGWCGFFLEAVRRQAEDNLVKAREILALYDSLKGPLGGTDPLPLRHLRARLDIRAAHLRGHRLRKSVRHSPEVGVADIEHSAGCGYRQDAVRRERAPRWRAGILGRVERRRRSGSILMPVDDPQTALWITFPRK